MPKSHLPHWCEWRRDGFTLRQRCGFYGKQVVGPQGQLDSKEYAVHYFASIVAGVEPRRVVDRSLLRAVRAGVKRNGVRSRDIGELPAATRRRILINATYRSPSWFMDHVQELAGLHDAFWEA